MYIIKNAWINIKRHLGRNILIGLILVIVSGSASAIFITKYNPNQILRNQT